MAVFSYTKLADYILDQFWGFSAVNALKNSVRYVAEDILGDPVSNSDKVNFSAITAVAANASFQTYTRPTGTSPGVRGVAISASSGTFTLIGTTSYTDITNLSVTLVTSGRPVMVGMVQDGTSNISVLGVDKSTATSVNLISGFFKILRDSTDIAIYQVTHAWNPADTSTNHAHYVPASSVFTLDAPTAGTYTYKAQTKCNTVEDRMVAQRIKLIAFEL